MNDLIKLLKANKNRHFLSFLKNISVYILEKKMKTIAKTFC